MAKKGGAQHAKPKGWGGANVKGGKVGKGC